MYIYNKNTHTHTQHLKLFSMLIADTVKINDQGIPEVLTKTSVEWDDVNYNIKEGEDEDEEEDEEGDDDEDDEDGKKDEGIVVKTAAGRATVLKSRLRERVTVGDDVLEAKQKRAEKQMRLFEQARERGLRNKSRDGSGGGGGGGGDAKVRAEDFKAYPSSDMYPYECKGNMIHVDMDNEAVLLPINGIPVPFHVSTIKSVNMPEADVSAYLRLNFYSPDVALGKDAPPQVSFMYMLYTYIM
jgi:nucleosome binding factor SPN SPT16 subunit